MAEPVGSPGPRPEGSPLGEELFTTDQLVAGQLVGLAAVHIPQVLKAPLHGGEHRVVFVHGMAAVPTILRESEDPGIPAARLRVDSVWIGCPSPPPAPRSAPTRSQSAPAVSRSPGVVDSLASASVHAERVRRAGIATMPVETADCWPLPHHLSPWASPPPSPGSRLLRCLVIPPVSLRGHQIGRAHV